MLTLFYSTHYCCRTIGCLCELVLNVRSPPDYYSPRRLTPVLRFGAPATTGGNVGENAEKTVASDHAHAALLTPTLANPLHPSAP